MSEYQLGYLVGAAVGIILIAAILIFVVRFSKKDRSLKCKFDERQLQKRGSAFKIGFFTLLLENAACLFLFAFLYDDPAAIRKLPITPATCIILQICIACAIFAGYCIWNDCYFSLNENRKALTVLFAVAALLNLTMAIRHLIQGDFIEDGVLDAPFASLACGILLLFVLLMLLAKHFRQKKDEE